MDNESELVLINDIERETERFLNRLTLLKIRLIESKNSRLYQSMERASLKRSALDLKSELTKITQIKAY